VFINASFSILMVLQQQRFTYQYISQLRNNIFKASISTQQGGTLKAF